MNSWILMSTLSPLTFEVNVKLLIIPEGSFFYNVYMFGVLENYVFKMQGKAHLTCSSEFTCK